MKKLSELKNNEEHGWALVQEWLNIATNHYEILPKEPQRADSELLNAQVSTRSPMGAIIYETGGMLIDSGWIRILGSGSPKLNRGLMEWNKGKTIENFGESPTYLLVADDVIGGYFAINAGRLESEIGNIYYLPPDTLEWESLGCGYSDFLIWTLSGDIQKFYESFRWDNWKADVQKMNGNQTFSFFPFLWTEYDDFEKLIRHVVPTEENFKLIVDMQSQISSSAENEQLSEKLR